MRLLLTLTLLAGCAVDVDESVDESDLRNCPDGLCEPTGGGGTTVASGADLAPGPAIDPCHFVYTDNGRKIGLRVFNNGNLTAPASLARVNFRVSYNGTITTPFTIVIPELPPGQYAMQYVMANTYCWNSLPGCDMYVTADSGNEIAELSETNNTTSWHCSK